MGGWADSEIENGRAHRELSRSPFYQPPIRPSAYPPIRPTLSRPYEVITVRLCSLMNCCTYQGPQPPFPLPPLPFQPQKA